MTSRNSVNGNSIENSVYKVTVDAKGDVSSIVDKRCQKELVASGKSIRLVVFNDCKSYSWPAWEILKETIDKTPVGIDEKVSVKLIDNGPLCKSLLISKSYGKTSINQYIRLYEGSRADRIDFCNEVDWQSMNSLLKAEFPLSVSNEKATYDLGLGSIQRGNNKETAYEVYSHEWADLTSADDSYGVTILNNCKYGWDKPDNNTLRMSLLYTPKTDRGFSYQSRQDLGYHTFTYSIVGHSGALDKSARCRQSCHPQQPHPRVCLSEAQRRPGSRVLVRLVRQSECHRPRPQEGGGVRRVCRSCLRECRQE
jgi:alpha-mannosidase